MADPNPTRLDSPSAVFVTSTDSSSRPLMPRFRMYTRSNARSDSMMVITSTTMLMGRSTGKMTRKNICRSLAPSMAAASRRLGSTALSPAR